jgi:putative phosphoribosyl transferase
MFHDRTAAGRSLAIELAGIVSGPSVVAAVPRGGVAVALPIAEELGAPLTVVHVRKLTAPLAPEYAVGAMDEDGHPIVAAAAAAALGLGPAEIAEAQARAARKIGQSMARYRARPLAPLLRGVTVVLVDDGLATGLTMQAALAYSRRHGAGRVVVAAPCASGPAAERLQRDADHFVCPIVDEGFAAVSEYYADFTPVTDDAVATMLAQDQGRLSREDVSLLGRRS